MHTHTHAHIHAHLRSTAKASLGVTTYIVHTYKDTIQAHTQLPELETTLLCGSVQNNIIILDFVNMCELSYFYFRAQTDC